MEKEKSWHKKESVEWKNENLSLYGFWVETQEKLTGHHKVSNNIVNYYLAGITDFACKFSSFAPGYVLKT